MGLTVTVILAGSLATLVVGALYVVYMLRKRADYFKKQGIPYLGSRCWQTLQLITGRVNIVDMDMAIYKEALECGTPFVGMSNILGQTCILVTDLDLVRNVYVKDFEHFINRITVKSLQSNDNMRRMLAQRENELWKGTRAKLSPTFTTGKIRRMFTIFRKSSERLEGYLKQQMEYPTKESVDLDFYRVFSKYGMDVIASCVFGVDGKAWDYPLDEKSTFEKMGNRFQMEFKGSVLVKFAVMTIAPKIADWLQLDILDTEAQRYVTSLVKTVIKHRRESGERQGDFLQLMLDTQQGILKADEEVNEIMNGMVDGNGASLFNEETGKQVTMDDDDIVANGIMFLATGIDGAHSAMIFTLFSLALEPEIQEKVYEEVVVVRNKHGGEMSYEAVTEMIYLNMVISETLRYYPVATRIDRTCTKDYLIPGTNFTIKKGVNVAIPVLGFHRDPKYFPEPDKFLPERFTAESKASRHPYVYMPFGHGPRNCIGIRFGWIKVKAAIAQLVYSYRFTPCSKTTIPVEYSSHSAIKPKGGMWLNVTVRK